MMLVALLSISFGILFFDRNSLAFLMPFVQPELGLNNTQVGLLASALSFTWACAALAIGYISDKTGSRKGLLIIATIVFSGCSFLSGMAHTFLAMLGARMLMGVAEGGFMPICQAMVAAEVRPKWRGLAMGVTQNFGSNFLVPSSRRCCWSASQWRMAGAAPSSSPALRVSSPRSHVDLDPQAKHWCGERTARREGQRLAQCSHQGTRMSLSARS